MHGACCAASRVPSAKVRFTRSPQHRRHRQGFHEPGSGHCPLPHHVIGGSWAVGDQERVPGILAGVEVLVAGAAYPAVVGSPCS